MDYKHRHIEAQVKRLAQSFKIVLILGARQVGKSTLLKHLFPKSKCIVFDPIEDLHNARKDPDLFLNAFPAPLILDEVQYAPELLSALKRRVDQSDAKGQYFLTGSQNLNVLKAVAESMAGRVGVLHLDPMTPLEMLDLGTQKGWLSSYLKNPDSLLQKEGRALQELQPFTRTLWRGSMPAALELQDEDIPIFYKSYFATYIERDIRTLENIQDLGRFDQFMGLAAMMTAQELNKSQIGRELGISPPTAEKWLHLLNYTYQWFELPPFFNNSIKRLSGKKKGFFKDTGLVCYRQRISSPEALAISPQLGHIFETWVVSHIHQQFVHLPVPPNAYHWRTQGGAEVDLVLELDGALYPIEVKCKTNPTQSDLSGLIAFRKSYPKHRIMKGLLIHAGSECYPLDADTIAVPWNWMLL
jgi:predicted AAA+ superfamily ATPase